MFPGIILSSRAKRSETTQNPIFISSTLVHVAKSQGFQYSLSFLYIQASLQTERLLRHPDDGKGTGKDIHSYTPVRVTLDWFFAFPLAFSTEWHIWVWFEKSLTCTFFAKSKSGFLNRKRFIDPNDPQRRWVLWIHDPRRKQWILPAEARNYFDTYISCLTTLLIFSIIFNPRREIDDQFCGSWKNRNTCTENLHCSSSQWQFNATQLRPRVLQGFI